MSMRCAFTNTSEMVISSMAILVVIGLLYKGVSSLWDDQMNPVFVPRLNKVVVRSA